LPRLPSPPFPPNARDAGSRDSPPAPRGDRRPRGLQRPAPPRLVQRRRPRLGPQVPVAPGRGLGRARPAGPRDRRRAHAKLRRAGGVPALAPDRRGPTPAEVARVPAVAQVGGPGQGKGSLTEKGPIDSVPAAVPTDEIYERYLKKAISEINELGDELARAGDAVRVPVVGSGHPLADVMLLKYSPQQSEIQEGVAFFGRSGQAVLKSLQRLHVDPLAVYGTNCLKFGTEDAEDAAAWLIREL